MKDNYMYCYKCKKEFRCDCNGLNEERLHKILSEFAQLIIRSNVWELDIKKVIDEINVIEQ